MLNECDGQYGLLCIPDLIFLIGNLRCAKRVNGAQHAPSDFATGLPIENHLYRVRDIVFAENRFQGLLCQF